MSDTGSVVLVTGGSKGLGRAIAVYFGSRGWAVAVNYCNDRDGAEQTCRLIRDSGGNAFAVQADVTQRDQVDEMVQRVETQTGGIGALVNNSGIILRKSFLDTTEKEWADTFSVNVHGVFSVGQAVAKRMVQRGQGSIINVSSITGFVAVENRSAYAATKGAVIMLTKGMALELAPFGVRVNAVAPGIMGTDGVIDNLSRASVLSEYSRYVPSGRLGYPEECAAAAYFLASDEARYITGSVLVVDGGLSSRQALPKF